MIKHYFALLLSVFSVSIYSNAQSLVINEILTKNDNSISSVDGEQYDWIELYNPSLDTVHLKDFSLSDDVNEPQKWSFTEGIIAPQSHLTVFASGESKTTISIVTQRQEDISPFGWNYADNDDDTSPGTSEVTYTLFQGSAFGQLNGKPAVAAKIYYGNPGDLGYSYAGVYVKFEGWDEVVNRSIYDRVRVRLYLEKDKKANLRFDQEGIEEWQNHNFPIVGTGDTTWYELPFSGETGLLDLSVLKGLSIIPRDNDFDQSFEFVMLNILFETDAQDRYNTNFKLSSSGESLYLSNANSQNIDAVTVPALVADFSYGRVTDGNNEWVVFNKATPDATNNEGTISKGICDANIDFSLTSGFYSGNQFVTLSGSSTIRYTIDGSTPDETSLLYGDAIQINKSTVIKAACFEAAKTPKTIFTNTYFIDYTTTLPVWSISTHPDNFFNEDSGIYVLGPEENWEKESPHFGANFWQDWERPIHVEFFEEDGNKALDFDCGIKVFGNYSRAAPKKSLSLHFRGKYDMSKLEYPIFPDYPGLSSFDDLLLRGSGGDEAFLHFRDGFHSELAKDLDFEKQKYRPSVLFINGEYWGIHNIREKSNEDSFEENFNISKDDIDLITSYFVELNGPTANSIYDFYAKLKNDELTYNQINEIIDVNSFIDYFAYEVYIANYDWAGNNSKYWRQSSTNGKWRWFMYDTDFSTSIYGHFGTHPSFDSFEKALVPSFGGWPSNDNSTLLPNKLFAFPEFKTAFVNRYCDLMNTLLTPENVFKTLQERVLDKIEEEVPVNRTRWNLGQEEWFNYLDEYKTFWETRAPFARKNMQNQLNLSDSVLVMLEVEPKGAGYIKLNTIEIEEEIWKGIYFEGIPVTLEAVPNAGFSFVKWESSSINLPNNKTALISAINITTDNKFTAIFSGDSIEQLITLSEINYHSPESQNTGDWLELHNYGDAPIDISGWLIKDEKLYNKYYVPQNTIIGTNDYVVFAENVSQFASIHPHQTVLGPLGYNLSNSGETIYIYNQRSQLQQTIRYSDKAPWETYADGEGGTLDLKKSGDDITNPENWASVCFGGSPFSKFDMSCPNIKSTEDDLTSSSDYAISPNPSSSFITIDRAIIAEANRLIIISSDGRKIKEFTSQHTLDISSLANGMYLLLIELNNHETRSYKFIKSS